MDPAPLLPAAWISSGLVDDAATALLRELLARSARRVSAEDTALWLAGEDSLAAVLGTGPHAEVFVDRYEQPLDEGIISLVYASGQPVCENAIAENPNHSKVLDTQLGITSDAMIAVPVSSAGQLVGVVTCVHTRPAGSADPAASFKAADFTEFEFVAACIGRLLDSCHLDAS